MTFGIFQNITTFEKFEGCENIENKRRRQCFWLSSSQYFESNDQDGGRKYL